MVKGEGVALVLCRNSSFAIGGICKIVRGGIRSMRSKGGSLDMFCSTKRRAFVAIVVWDVVVGRCGKIGGTRMTLEVASSALARANSRD